MSGLGCPIFAKGILSIDEAFLAKETFHCLRSPPPEYTEAPSSEYKPTEMDDSAKKGG